MLKFRFKWARIFIVSSFSWLNPVEAAILYVDKDSSCPGSGSSNSPYCTIQRAFNVVRPGDVVRIRDSASPYDERAVGSKSGTSTAPIIVEPDSGHRPILRYTGRSAEAGAIEIRDADHWHIKGLTFDGSGIQTSRYALLLYAYTRDITGHQIVKNTFRNWGGTGENTKSAAAVVLRPSYSTDYNPLHVKDSVISDNNFNGNAQSNIHLTQTKNVVVERNTIQNTRCGRKPNGTAGVTGIKAAAESVGTIIRNNTVGNHQLSEDCLLPNQGLATYAGIYCDTGPTDGQILGNTVYNIDKGRTGNTNPRATGVDSIGIYLESRCHDWKVHNNIVYNVGTNGLRNGSPGTGDPNRNVWTNNTVFGISRASFWIVRGNELTVKNNILVHNGVNAAIELTKTAVTNGPHKIDHNLYWDMKNGTRIGRWGDYASRDFTAWRQSCKCDSKGVSGDPRFMSVASGSENFRLTSSSPGRGRGEYGVDIGAYQSNAASNAAPPTSAPAAPTWISIK